MKLLIIITPISSYQEITEKVGKFKIHSLILVYFEDPLILFFLDR